MKKRWFCCSKNRGLPLYIMDNNNIMENINDKLNGDKEKLLSEKKDLIEKRTILMKESNPLKWGDSTPKEFVEINQRIERINSELDQLN